MPKLHAYVGPHSASSALPCYTLAHPSNGHPDQPAELVAGKKCILHADQQSPPVLFEGPRAYEMCYCGQVA